MAIRCECELLPSPRFPLSPLQYACYLSALAERGKLNVRTRTEVTAVRPFVEGDGFEVEVIPAAGEGANGFEVPTVLRSRYVVWAAGEFQVIFLTSTFSSSLRC